MFKVYENNGIITIRVGKQLKGVLQEVTAKLKKHLQCPSFNNALVEIIRDFLLQENFALEKSQRIALRLDQEPRAGRK